MVLEIIGKHAELECTVGFWAAGIRWQWLLLTAVMTGFEWITAPVALICGSMIEDRRRIELGFAG